MFFRIHTDGTRQPVDLTGLYAGPQRTACWIIGGGPSLSALDHPAIAASPLPKFAVNLAGHRLLRPTFWTSYDPTVRFHRSIYLDPSIVKFVHVQRAMDLVPDSTFKVCDSPATLFFHRDKQRGFHDFLGPGPQGQHPLPSDPPATVDSPPLSSLRSPLPITDWQDSLIQAIDLAFRLGFRILYLAGCDMLVQPSAEQLSHARTAGVEYQPREPLRDFFARCRTAGLSQESLEALESPTQYHFDEQKPLAAAIQTDWHYFRVAQYLRLSRRAMALAGLELVSVTPGSRLNDFFPYRPVSDVLADVHLTVGDPGRETTRGRYTSVANSASTIPMKDFPPHNWPRRQSTLRPAPVPPGTPRDSAPSPRDRLRRALDDLPEVPVDLNEVG